MTLPSYALNQPSFPEMYEKWLAGPIFRPWAQITFDELNLTPGDRVLDIACGTGVVARVAKERLGESGDVVGIDVSPDMLALPVESVRESTGAKAMPALCRCAKESSLILSCPSKDYSSFLTKPRQRPR